MDAPNGSREFVERLRLELPRLLRDDVEVRGQIIALLSDYLTTRQETAAILTELRQMREDFDRRMDEQGSRIEEQGRRIEEQGRRLEEHSGHIVSLAQRIEEQGRRIEEQGRRIEEQGRRLEEQGRRLEEHSGHIVSLAQRIEEQGRCIEEHTRTLGAIGARWGMMAEEAFRRSVRALFADQAEIQVEHWRHHDVAGKVFGYPTDVDMDVVVRNGTLLLIEIKSSLSGADVAEFWRRAELYREVTGRQATRLLMIGAFVDDRAREVAGRLGIEVVSGVTPPAI